jgi:WD40 repeat protein
MAVALWPYPGHILASANTPPPRTPSTPRFDNQKVISCSSDGTVRIWDAKSCEQLHAFRWGAGGSVGVCRAFCVWTPLGGI